MNDESSKFEVTLSGMTTKTVRIDILDSRYGIKEVLNSKDFPIHTWPCEGDGYINMNGKAIARYYISDADISEDIEEVITSDGDELDVTELDLGV